MMINFTADLMLSKIDELKPRVILEFGDGYHQDMRLMKWASGKYCWQPAINLEEPGTFAGIEVSKVKDLYGVRMRIIHRDGSEKIFVIIDAAGNVMENHENKT